MKTKNKRREKYLTLLRWSMIFMLMLNIFMSVVAFSTNNNVVEKEVKEEKTEEAKISSVVEKMILRPWTLQGYVGTIEVEASELDSLDWMSNKETSEAVSNLQEENNPLRTIESRKNELEYRTGYTRSRLNLRERETTDSEVLTVIGWNEKIRYVPVNDKWAFAKYKNTYGYVYRKYIADNKIEKRTYDVPFYEHQKSYMDYRKIEDVSSKAYKLQITDAYTGKYGVRQVNGRYLCALGTYYVEDDDIGRYVDLVLRNGTVIPCIIGDNKDDRDTDSTNRYTCHDNSIVEFVVDTPSLRYTVKRDGNLNKATSKWNSSIKEVVVYNYKHQF